MKVMNWSPTSKSPMREDRSTGFHSICQYISLWSGFVAVTVASGITSLVTVAEGVAVGLPVLPLVVFVGLADLAGVGLGVGSGFDVCVALAVPLVAESDASRGGRMPDVMVHS